MRTKLSSAEIQEHGLGSSFLAHAMEDYFVGKADQYVINLIMGLVTSMVYADSANVDSTHLRTKVALAATNAFRGRKRTLPAAASIWLKDIMLRIPRVADLFAMIFAPVAELEGQSVMTFICVAQEATTNSQITRASDLDGSIDDMVKRSNKLASTCEDVLGFNLRANPYDPINVDMLKGMYTDALGHLRAADGAGAGAGASESPFATMLEMWCDSLNESRNGSPSLYFTPSHLATILVACGGCGGTLARYVSLICHDLRNIKDTYTAKVLQSAACFDDWVNNVASTSVIVSTTLCSHALSKTSAGNLISMFRSITNIMTKEGITVPEQMIAAGTRHGYVDITTGKPTQACGWNTVPADPTVQPPVEIPLHDSLSLFGVPLVPLGPAAAALAACMPWMTVKSLTGAANVAAAESAGKLPLGGQGRIKAFNSCFPLSWTGTTTLSGSKLAIGAVAPVESDQDPTRVLENCNPARFIKWVRMTTCGNIGSQDATKAVILTHDGAPVEEDPSLPEPSMYTSAFPHGMISGSGAVVCRGPNAGTATEADLNYLAESANKIFHTMRTLVGMVHSTKSSVTSVSLAKTAGFTETETAEYSATSGGNRHLSAQAIYGNGTREAVDKYLTTVVTQVPGQGSVRHTRIATDVLNADICRVESALRDGVITFAIVPVHMAPACLLSAQIVGVGNTKLIGTNRLSARQTPVLNSVSNPYVAGLLGVTAADMLCGAVVLTGHNEGGLPPGRAAAHEFPTRIHRKDRIVEITPYVSKGADKESKLNGNAINKLLGSRVDHTISTAPTSATIHALLACFSQRIKAVPRINGQVTVPKRRPTKGGAVVAEEADDSARPTTTNIDRLTDIMRAAKAEDGTPAAGVSKINNMLKVQGTLSAALDEYTNDINSICGALLSNNDLSIRTGGVVTLPTLAGMADLKWISRGGRELLATDILSARIALIRVITSAVSVMLEKNVVTVDHPGIHEAEIRALVTVTSKMNHMLDLLVNCIEVIRGTAPSTGFSSFVLVTSASAFLESDKERNGTTHVTQSCPTDSVPTLFGHGIDPIVAASVTSAFVSVATALTSHPDDDDIVARVLKPAVMTGSTTSHPVYEELVKARTFVDPESAEAVVRPNLTFVMYPADEFIKATAEEPLTDAVVFDEITSATLAKCTNGTAPSGGKFINSAGQKVLALGLPVVVDTNGLPVTPTCRIVSDSSPVDLPTTHLDTIDAMIACYSIFVPIGMTEHTLMPVFNELGEIIAWMPAKSTEGFSTTEKLHVTVPRSLSTAMARCGSVSGAAQHGSILDLINVKLAPKSRVMEELLLLQGILQCVMARDGKGTFPVREGAPDVRRRVNSTRLHQANTWLSGHTLGKVANHDPISTRVTGHSTAVASSRLTKAEKEGKRLDAALARVVSTTMGDMNDLDLY